MKHALVVVFVPQTEIYVEVDEVPLTGISASERVSVTASATVNDGSAGNTLVSVGGPRATPIFYCLRTSTMLRASVFVLVHSS